MKADELYMQRAMDLALNGLGTVSPNPLVGSVVVHNNQIIGEGWHQKYGEAHAEVNAINSVSNHELLKESTVYVNLEPCAHYGKTPPCARLLTEKKVEKVVISTTDPNPLVAGKGIEILENSGIEVIKGVLKEKGEYLNRRFFTNHHERRPYIILKWAQSSDGFIARKNYDSKWISDEHSRKLVHKWRAQEDGILVGTNTAQYDNPKLNVRDWEGNDPVRIVIDPNLRLDPDLNLFDHSIDTFCYNLTENSEEEKLHRIKLSHDNFMGDLFKDLMKRKISSVIVEGGRMVLDQLISNGLWDEARVFISALKLEEGIDAPIMTQKPEKEETLINDRLQTYYKS